MRGIWLIKIPLTNYYYLTGCIIFQICWLNKKDKLQKTKKRIDKKADHSTASIGIIAFLKTFKA